MRNLNYFFYFFSLFFITIISCEEESIVIPKASFTMSTSSTHAFDTISFINTSENAEIFEWDFGDIIDASETNPSHSSETNPTHFYWENGVYTIKLIVENKDGKDSISQTITITDPPFPYLGYWNLSEGKYNNEVISGLSGYFKFEDDGEFEAKIQKESSYIILNSYYIYFAFADKYVCYVPSKVLLNGLSGSCLGGKCQFTSANMSLTEFDEFGSTGIGNGTMSIINNEFIVESTNGKTFLRYHKQ
jgi:PKD repeat protein